MKLKIVSQIVLPATALLLATGCSTMSVSTLTTGQADSYAQHQEQNGLAVAIQPMTDKREINQLFKTDLLENGLFPILVVAENGGKDASFIIAKENVSVISQTNIATSTGHDKNLGSGASGAANATGIAAGAMILASPLLAAPLIIASAKLASDATVVQYNLADKELYSRTLGPGDKEQGFVFFQFQKKSPPAGDYHVVLKAKNASTGGITTYDFPITINLPK